jgi:hypothetical protein
MPEIAEWLQQLGFGQYAQRFAENDVDFRASDNRGRIETCSASNLPSGESS